MCKALAATLLLLAAAAAAAQQGLGDPTKPTSLAAPEPAQVESGPRWRLQSTLVADSRRLAVINGRTVSVGEQVDGATLRDVRREGVTLEIEGRSVELRVVPGGVEVKRPGG